MCKGIISKLFPVPKDGLTLVKAAHRFCRSNKGQYHLIVVDSFSIWPKVMNCKSPSRTGTIRFLHELFARFSIPDTIVLDNGTQYTIKQFKDFCKSFSIVHITTALYHQRSNGLAEKIVNTFSWSLKKSLTVTNPLTISYNFKEYTEWPRIQVIIRVVSSRFNVSWEKWDLCPINCCQKII